MEDAMDKILNYLNQISNNDLRNKCALIYNCLQKEIDALPAADDHQYFYGGWKLYTINVITYALEIFDKHYKGWCQGVRKDDVILLGFLHNLGALYEYKVNKGTSYNRPFVTNDIYGGIPSQIIVLNALSGVGLLLDDIQLRGLSDATDSRLAILIKISSLMAKETNKKTAPNE